MYSSSSGNSGVLCRFGGVGANVATIPASLLGRNVGLLTAGQEALLARAVVLAYDLDIAVLDS